MPGDSPVNAGCVDPVLAQIIELETLDGPARTSALDHGLEERLLTLGLVVGLVGVPQDDVSSLVVVKWLVFINTDIIRPEGSSNRL